VKTGSRGYQNNQMGGAIDIVNFKWSKFSVEESLYTDSIGPGIINYIVTRLDNYWAQSVNVHFMCTSVTTGLVTLYSRVTRYQQQANLYPSLKCLSWMKTNCIISPDFKHLQHLPGYHTNHSGGATQTQTSIDHSMHTPFPKKILLEELGVVNWEKKAICRLPTSLDLIYPD
jgi:hypothetical protein